MAPELAAGTLALYIARSVLTSFEITLHAASMYSIAALSATRLRGEWVAQPPIYTASTECPRKPLGYWQCYDTTTSLRRMTSKSWLNRKQENDAVIALKSGVR